MTVLDRVEIILGADLSDLELKLSRAGQLMAATGRQMQRVGRSLSLKVTAPIAAIGALAIKAAVDLDSLTRGLEVSAGSAEAASQQLADLEEIAKMPGLNFKEAIEGATRLNTALGNMPDNISLTNRSLAAFGNAVALTGGGKSELDRVITQLGTMAATGRVLASDLRPIIAVAPAVGDALREAFGTVDAVEIEALGLTVEEFFDSFLTGLEGLPRATSGAAEAFKNLSDSMDRARAAIGDVLLPVVTDLVEKFADLLEAVAEADPKIIIIGVSLAAVAAVIGPMVVGLGFLITAVGTLTTAFIGLNTVLATGGIAAIITGGGIIAGLAVLAGGLGYLIGKLTSANREFSTLSENISTTATNLALIADNPLAGAANLPLLDALENVGLFNNILGETPKLLGTVNEELDGTAGSATGVGLAVTTAGDAFRAFGDNLALIFSQLLNVDAVLESVKAGMATLKPVSDELAVSFSKQEKAALAAKEALAAVREEAEGDIDTLGRLGSILSRVSALMSAFDVGLPFLGQASGLLGLFAGGFANGGTIPAGQFGLVGERGPEFVSGPATVTPMSDPGAFAGAVLARIGPPPQIASPDAVATDRWWRALHAAQVEVGKHDGVRYDR